LQRRKSGSARGQQEARSQLSNGHSTEEFRFLCDCRVCRNLEIARRAGGPEGEYPPIAVLNLWILTQPAGCCTFKFTSRQRRPAKMPCSGAGFQVVLVAPATADSAPDVPSMSASLAPPQSAAAAVWVVPCASGLPHYSRRPFRYCDYCVKAGFSQLADSPWLSMYRSGRWWRINWIFPSRTS